MPSENSHDITLMRLRLDLTQQLDKDFLGWPERSIGQANDPV